jgi:NADH dehydrogenase/NADH:ubiquinone oxidoreductase subunit G
MQIQIDGIKITVSNQKQNLVEFARMNGISIPAPCFFAGRPFGCCQVCVVEIDHNLGYACCTKPADGMNIIVNRDDLKELRKMKMKKYRDIIKSGKINDCG